MNTGVTSNTLATAIRRVVRFTGICFAGIVNYSPESHSAFATEGLSCTLGNVGRGTLATCEGSLGENGPEVSIALEGIAPNSVTRISLSRDGEARPFQRLPIQAQPIIDQETVGILFIDFNFDGYRDLAVMAFLPAGPNVPYLYFLYNPQKQKFVRSRQLDAITSPEVLKSRKLLQSNWRSSATESGEDLWTWQHGHAFLIERIKRRWTSRGNCLETFYKLKNGQLRQYKRRRCKK